MSEFATHLVGNIVEGLKLTLVLLIVCGSIGNLLAVPVALARTSRRVWLKCPAFCFILVMRGTPFLVQLFFAYYGVGELLSHSPQIRHSIWWPVLREALGYAFVVLSLNTAAYTGEIWRGAIQAVSKGQIEAAQSLGLSWWRTTLLVTLPQAFRLALPALASQTVVVLKATALTSTITVFELTGAVSAVRTETFRVYEPLFGAAICYFVLTFCITSLFSALERRLAV